MDLLAEDRRRRTEGLGKKMGKDNRRKLSKLRNTKVSNYPSSRQSLPACVLLSFST